MRAAERESTMTATSVIQQYILLFSDDEDERKVV